MLFHFDLSIVYSKRASNNRPAVAVKRLRYVAFVDSEDFVKFVLVERSFNSQFKCTAFR